MPSQRAALPSPTREAPAAVVIGGSAGSFEILRNILRLLPDSIRVPIVIALHLPPQASDELPALFDAVCALPVKYAEDKEPLSGGAVYFAPPAYHLLIESGRTFALSTDAPVHYSRPAIDVLFESACDVYGAQLLAILLSGASADGAAGLHEIHLSGGQTIVQTPQSAEAPTMPAAALALFAPRHVWSPSEIANGLPRLLASAGVTSEL